MDSADACDALPMSVAEAQVALRRAPRIPFGEASQSASGNAPPGNLFRFHLGPAGSGIRLSARVKKPGPAMTGEQVDLQFCRDPAEQMDAYERLIGDALAGNPDLFASQEMVEAAWRVFDRAIAARTPLHAYEPDSWGPAEAAQLAAPWGGWHRSEEGC